MESNGCKFKKTSYVFFLELMFVFYSNTFKYLIDLTNLDVGLDCDGASSNKESTQPSLPTIEIQSNY